MRVIKVYNDSDIDVNYGGKTITPDSSYTIPTLDVLVKFRRDELFIADITNNNIIINNGEEDLTDVTKALEWLFADNPTDIQTKSYPFDEKITREGYKIFRRKHGVSKSIASGAADTIEIIVPYNLAKINKIELINCNNGDLVNFKVYDNAAGTISTVPNYMLNQFGFDVVVPDGFYVDESNYDADVIQGMKIEITYRNNTGSDKIVGMNVTLHELKDA